MRTLIFVYGLFVALTYGHPVPDGLVFRGIQVVARSDRIELRYQVGLSDTMVRSELLRLGAEPTEDAAEALARYRDQVFPRLLDRIDVTIDGKPTELIPMRADIIRQQHAQIEFVYRVPSAPTTEPVRLVLLDENYPAVPGYHLAAIRGRGDVQVLPAGPDELFHRLSDIPSTEDTAPSAIPTIRKIDAYIRWSALPAEGAGKPRTAPTEMPGAGTLQGSLSSTDAASGQDVTAGNRKDAPSVADGKSDSAVEVLPIDDESESRRGRVIWVSLFAALALMIALLWIRSTRNNESTKEEE